MKYLLSIIVGGFLLVNPLAAQQNISLTTSKSAPTETVQKSIAENLNFKVKVAAESSVNDLEAAAWSRNVYRVVSDSLEVNAPVFTPTKSNKEQANLFSILVSLLKDNKIKAYRFNADNTCLSDAEAISLTDIPQSNEIHTYYVREQYFFDAKTAQGGVVVKAICPVLLKKQDAASNTVTAEPLFWVSFDEVSPYLMGVSASNLFTDLGKGYNTSMFDFFRMRNYKGDIYSIGNRVLADYYATSADVVLEQANLEKELKQIEVNFARFK